MPVTNYVPDFLVYRYCNVCYRMAELQVHSKSAFQTVRRGRVPCRHRYDDIPCMGRLAIKPRDMRRMMVERNRQTRRITAEILEWDDEPYQVIDAAEIAHRERLEAERMREPVRTAVRSAPGARWQAWGDISESNERQQAQMTRAIESLPPNRRHRRAASVGALNPEDVNRGIGDIWRGPAPRRNHERDENEF